VTIEFMGLRLERVNPQRTTQGACKRDYRTVSPHGRFRWPASAAGLQDMVCPSCGRPLDQTTSQAQGPWTDLDAATAKALAEPRRRRRVFINKRVAAALAELGPIPPFEYEGAYVTGASMARRNDWGRARSRARQLAEAEAEAAYDAEVAR
jgi:hypothetical protein